ncbi:hypothetical protein ALC53_06659, partial [Atta colombica]
RKFIITSDKDSEKSTLPIAWDCQVNIFKYSSINLPPKYLIAHLSNLRSIGIVGYSYIIRSCRISGDSSLIEMNRFPWN